MSLTRTQKRWAVGGGLSALAAFLGYELYHHRLFRAVPLPLHAEHEHKKKHKHHDDENERGEYGHKKHKHHKELEHGDA